MPRMPESPSVARELVAHSQALRRLARDLVGRSDADDLVQDTAVRALRSPPAEPDGLFGWLAAVMRRLAANHHRGETRRQRRETANGHGESAPSAEAEATQRDHVRAVTEALWSLPEPYKATLLQRYFQDLSPSRIAERTATPLPTVKSRLQRGLEMLRANLAQRDGRDWRAALASSLGLPLRFRRAWPLLSLSSTSTLGKAAVTAACAVVAISWWAVSPTAAPPEPIAAADATPRDVVLAAAGDAAATTEREAVASAPADAVELAQPFSFELRCRVVDAEGLPVAGAHAALAPLGCALGLSPPTDADGRVTVTWRARVPALTMAVGYAHQGTHTSLQLVAMAAGEVAHVGFVAGLAPLPASVRLDDYGRQVATVPQCSQANRDCRSCHHGMEAANVFEVRGELRAGLHPDAVFGDRLVAPPPGPEMNLVGFDDFTGGSAVGIGRTAPATNLANSIGGRVFGADGAPVGGVRVTARHTGFVFSTHSKPDGSFVLAHGAVAGSVEVRAGGGPEGLAMRTVDVVAGRQSGIELLLQPGRTLRGTARGGDGNALNGARVEYVAPPGHDSDVATVGPDGAFAFANLPPGPARLLVWGVKGEKLPIAEEAVVADGGEVTIDLRSRPGSSGGLRVSVRGHDGEAPTDCEVRAWQLQTGRGAFLERREDGAFHAHGLAAGFYRVEVGALCSGFRDLGQHWVDGAGLADLGTVQLAPPGRLLIEAPEAPEAFEATGELELYARRADVDVRADVVTPGSRELALPAGRWLLLWKQDGALGASEFSLAGGGSASVRVGR